MVRQLIYMFARLVWRANEKPGAHMDVENRAAPEARSSRSALLRRGPDGSVQEQVLVVRDPSGAAADSDGTDWSKVWGNLTVARILVCGTIVAMGAASAVLGFYAEAYRSEIVYFINGECVYPFDVEGSYSAAAAAVLVAAQIIVNVLACYAPDNPLTGFPTFVIRTLLFSWVTFVVAMYYFMIGDVAKNPDFYWTFSNGRDGKCFVVVPLVYAKGSTFAIITMFCHVTAYVAVYANSSPAEAIYTRIIPANYDPERPFPVSSTAPVVRLSSASTLQQREAVWTKLQELKDNYLEDMKQLHGRLMQKSSMPTISPALRQKVEHYIQVVDNNISYLMATKERLPNAFNQDKLADFEKQIVYIMESVKPRQHKAQQQQLESATEATPTPATIPAIPPPPVKSSSTTVNKIRFTVS